MYLDIALNDNAKQSMEQFIEGENINHMPDPCDYLRDRFNQWEEDFANSPTPWWDFPEGDLTIHNLNELLVISAKFTERHSHGHIYSTDHPLNVDTLLRRYAVWMIDTERQHFYQFWEDAWEKECPEEECPEEEEEEEENKSENNQSDDE
jgi:hypothetical protein